MDPSALLIPRQHSRTTGSERCEEEDFEVLVTAVGKLLATSSGSSERSVGHDVAVLAATLAELEARWPSAAGDVRPRIGTCGRRTA